MPLLAVCQERCGTVIYTQKLQQKNLSINDQAFEHWLRSKIDQRNRRSPQQRTHATYEIPVVVHVIHNNEAIGIGANISEAQILSQIQVLNDDYKRNNADAVNTPSAFTSLAGSLNIEFILAKQDPEGLATTGIVRIDGGQPEWTMEDNYTLKSLSYWPSEDYLNIWVCNMENDPNEIIGYAQFPVSDLPGLENSSENALTDGVVIHHKAFGSEDAGDFDLDPGFNKGRTATHEIAHFFGLRHIWGDDNVCNDINDYVTDTPDQNNSSRGCPTHPSPGCNDQPIMFQNFLDYTSDACMNLFTKGQVQRMETVLQNSPRRKSLLTSPGLQLPQPKPNDLGIRTFISPLAGECTGSTIPEIEIRNYGSNTITQTEIQLKKNGGVVFSQVFTLNLQPLQSTTLSFPAFILTEGEQLISFQIISTNGVTDGNINNNIIERTVSSPPSIATPFVENFNSTPPEWSIFNPDQLNTWSLAQAPYNVSSNQAMKLNFYDYEDKLGEIDALITPAFDLSTVPVALLSFDFAYARYSGSNDALRVVVLKDCNNDINAGTEIFYASGFDLATASSTNLPFVPANADEWSTKKINLSAFRNDGKIQLAFVGINDWGNNLYIDNIKLITDGIRNITLKQILNPSPVTCNEIISPVLLIENAGVEITSFDVQYTINEQSNVVSYNDLQFKSGTEASFQLPSIHLQQAGMNVVSVQVFNPNGDDDFDPSDNFITQQFVVNSTESKIPFRENFEESINNRWAIVNPTDGINWQIKTLTDNKAVYFPGFSNTLFSDVSWLASPVLDFSVTDEASLFFDLSYAYIEDTNDKLQILASTDCGETFNIVLKEFSGKQLSSRTISGSWEPTSENDWSRQYVSMSSLAGLEEVRLAFVFTSNHGNNIYLDNIEIFLSDDPNPVTIESTFSVYPNPTPHNNVDAKITFNLPELQNVTLEVVNSMGQTISSQVLTDVLNQTYDLELNNASTGIYIIRVKTATLESFTRLMIK